MVDLSPTDGFVAPAEFARTLGVPTARVMAWIRDGALPAVRLGRLILIPVDALRLVLERQEEK
jgi:excisionase family DNA binding protein